MGCRWLGFRRAGGLGRVSGQQLEVAYFSTQDNLPPPPRNNDAAMRNEGVGILVDKKATALRCSVSNNPILSLMTKRMVYRAIVLSVLLYGAET